MTDKIDPVSDIHETESALIGEYDEQEEELLRHAILRLNGNILGIVCGIVMALVIFAATNWLVIKGGEGTGAHLSLLSNFFFGYSVTFVGSFIGAAYGLLTGYILGYLIAWIYNRIVILLGHN